MPNRRARPSCNSHPPVMNGDTERGEEGQCLRTGVKMRRSSYGRGGLFVKSGAQRLRGFGNSLFGLVKHVGHAEETMNHPVIEPSPLLRLAVLLPYRFQISAHLARRACARHILFCILFLWLLLVILFLLEERQDPSQLILALILLFLLLICFQPAPCPLKLR